MKKRVNVADLEKEKENERLRKELGELDELPGNKGSKTARHLKGVEDIPTSVRTGIRSIPGKDDRYYLDLYLLQKERERLVKETASIKRQRLRVGRKVFHIDKGVAEREEKALAGMTIMSGEPAAGQRESGSKRGKEKASDEKQEAPNRYEYKEEEWNRFTMEY